MARRAGATLLRGGAYKPRTSPYAFQGLGVAGAADPGRGARGDRAAGRDRGRRRGRRGRWSPSTPTCCRSAPATCRTSRCCRRSAAAGKPVMLKRGLTATYRGVADGRRVHRPARQPRHRAVRARRSGRSSRRSATCSTSRRCRWCTRCRTCRSSSTRRTRPAAATWCCRWPGPAIAAGADGVMVDVHPRPGGALCDGAQALSGDLLDELAVAVATIPPLLGRRSAVTAEKVRPAR